MYDIQMQDFQYLNSSYFGCSSTGFNLGHIYIQRAIVKELMGEEFSRYKSFSFGENNGNCAVNLAGSDLSWMKGKDLYHERVNNRLEEAKIDQVTIEKLSLA